MAIFPAARSIRATSIRIRISRRTLSTSRVPSPYHALLGLPEQSNPFVIDTALLKRNFLQAQRGAHPDSKAGQGSEAINLAAARSADINQAYQALLSPLKRAEYLLSLRGISLGETDKLDGAVDLEQQEFIMEVMEARSELEEAASEDEIVAVRATNKERVNVEVDIIEKAFAEGDYDTALKSSVRLRYWEGLEAAAKELPH